jgi:hypothetical protein
VKNTRETVFKETKEQKNKRTKEQKTIKQFFRTLKRVFVECECSLSAKKCHLVKALLTVVLTLLRKLLF